MKIKTIKTLLSSIIALLTLLLFFQACEKGKNTSVIGTFYLRKDVLKEVNQEGKKVEMKVTDFNDSRCPINADCVGTGMAKIKMTFIDEIKEQTIELCKGGCFIGAIPTKNKIALNGDIYELRLEEITPYPTWNKNIPEPSTAKVIISKTTL